MRRLVKADRDLALLNELAALGKPAYSVERPYGISRHFEGGKYSPPVVASRWFITRTERDNAVRFLKSRDIPVYCALNLKQGMRP